MRTTRRVNESWCSCLFYLFIMLEGFFSFLVHHSKPGCFFEVGFNLSPFQLRLEHCIIRPRALIIDWESGKHWHRQLSLSSESSLAEVVLVSDCHRPHIPHCSFVIPSNCSLSQLQPPSLSCFFSWSISISCSQATHHTLVSENDSTLNIYISIIQFN